MSSFTCAACGGEFTRDPGFTREEAIEEMEANFGEIPEEERLSCCDGCYARLTEQHGLHFVAEGEHGTAEEPDGFRYRVVPFGATPEPGTRAMTVEATSPWSPSSRAEAEACLGKPMADMLFPPGGPPEPKPQTVAYYEVYRAPRRKTPE